MSALLERYLACWNETDSEARRKLIDDTFVERASYTDPLAEVQGGEAIDAMIASVQAQFPGLVFTPGDQWDEHHRQARFTWRLGPAGEDAIVEGFDVVALDGDGRIQTVLGFLDRVPTG